MLLGQPSTSLHGRLWQVARSRPDAAAVCDDSRALTYAQLKQQALALASALNDAGVPPGGLVGLRLPRGVDIAVGIIGILAHGSAYVPIDPQYPNERQTYIEEDARLSTIVEWDDGDGAPAWFTPAGRPTRRRMSPKGPPTSSTPPGPQEIPRGDRRPPPGPGDARRGTSDHRPRPRRRVDALPLPSFDFSVWELWGPC
ncbi:AMP-binding protein [Nocardiopsis composta]